MAKSNKMTVAHYISQQIVLCGKGQNVISEEIGYENPNVITMLKQGKTKLPINKVRLLALSLEVDPVYLLKLTMTEYMPDTWGVIEEILGKNAITKDEENIIKVVREEAGIIPVSPKTKEEEDKLKSLVREWVIEAEKQFESDINRKKI